ncbi:MAG: hypothetical protein UCV58_04745, partial [Clostridium saudiense]|nr:hypothetical protein [Clostridium saudiense]
MIKKWIKISILLATITSTTMGLISCGNSVTNTSGNNIESSEQAQVLNDGSKLKLAKNEDGTDTNYYYYNAYEDGFTPTRADVVIPTYYIFAGSKTQEEANKIVEELNMINNLEQWGAQVYVVNPLNEEGYGNDDKEAFIDLVGIGVKNVKVIGIDEGSTFVNNYISQSCYFVAGMMLYGG